ncbi:MAG: hypothetical protein HYS16_00290 [Deltaproteobacteria bacterium]|nr:MAG: hypothetical protein HYS16_00290 [Deltaproteobacteria bacterium]
MILLSFFLLFFTCTPISLNTFTPYSLLSKCLFHNIDNKNCSPFEIKKMLFYIENKHHLSKEIMQKKTFEKSKSNFLSSQFFSIENLTLLKLGFYNEFLDNLKSAFSLHPIGCVKSYLILSFININLFPFLQHNPSTIQSILLFQSSTNNTPSNSIGHQFYLKFNLNKNLHIPMQKDLMAQKFLKESFHALNCEFEKELPSQKEKMLLKIIPLLNSNLFLQKDTFTYIPSLHFLSILLAEKKVLQSFLCLQKIQKLNPQYATSLKLNKHSTFLLKSIQLNL